MVEIKKKSMAQRLAAIIAAGVMASALALPAMAFADNGVQPGTQDYDSKTSAWDPATNGGEGGGGQIQLVYSTEGGQWHEPGADPTTPDNPGPAHDNGTYMVTIPKLIKYENMAIGTVNQSADYTINVRGALAAGKVVNVTATASGSLTNTAQAANDGSSINFTTTQGKTSWSANDAFGTLNADGSLSGTDATDNISMTGTVKSAGTWKGVVQYSSAVANA